MLKLYSTLTKKIEEFQPTDGNQVRMYTCGPTVYNYAHIGNLRSYIFADLLYRTLRYDGYEVQWVMNITDIEDKIIKAVAAKHGPQATVDDLRNYTDEFYQKFLLDLDEVNVSRSDITFIKVTDVIPQIQEFIVELINKEYAYTAEDGSTYFNINKYHSDFHDYGRLVGEKFLEGKKTGARVKVDEYDKDNLSDFALWKAWDEADANIFWEHPTLGKGRRGWHIECSVINNVAFKGQPTDIHTGGVDLIFPHHTNEIAQSQPFYHPFARYWFHSEHLLVDNKRMAKSAKNFYTLQDLKEVVSDPGLSLRYLFLQSKYNTQQNFTKDSLAAAHKGLEHLRNIARSEGKSTQLDRYINDDLNIPKALGDSEVQQHLLAADSVFGLKLTQPNQLEVPSNVQGLLDQRERARLAKDFAKSDQLRHQLDAMGYEVEDTAAGPKLKPK